MFEESKDANAAEKEFMELFKDAEKDLQVKTY